MVSNTRLYGAAIAFASGLYSLWSASMAAEMVASSWLMAVVGVVVLVHGAILLTDYADRLGSASGPLMIVYAVVMLLIQSLLGAGMMDTGSGMAMSGGMGGSGLTAGMGWDAGMVTLALLMLVSGLIMTRNGQPSADTGRM
jgi:asparagine N-glycosylation enzyme membrane subunit Stt3